jgi:NTP pyrophosphatase (non-canonical NTP hydrolase)
MGLIMHEMMHQSFFMHNYDANKEEEIITWAEEEAYEIFKIIREK